MGTFILASFNGILLHLYIYVCIFVGPFSCSEREMSTSDILSVYVGLKTTTVTITSFECDYTRHHYNPALCLLFVTLRVCDKCASNHYYSHESSHLYIWMSWLCLVCLWILKHTQREYLHQGITLHIQACSIPHAHTQLHVHKHNKLKFNYRHFHI